MKRNLLCAPAGLALALGVGPAHGKECKGVSFADQMQADAGALKLNGLGLRQATILRIDVYVAALYVAQPSRDADAVLGANAPWQLVLHFVRDVGRSDAVRAWDEGFESNAKGQLPALRERIETFKAPMADMKVGERLTMSHKPGAGVDTVVKSAAKARSPAMTSPGRCSRSGWGRVRRTRT